MSTLPCITNALFLAFAFGEANATNGTRILFLVEELPSVKDQHNGQNLRNNSAVAHEKLLRQNK